MKVLIKSATLADAQTIVALLNPIIEAGRYTVLQGPLALDAQIAFMQSFPERGVFHVALAQEAGSLLGMQDVMPLAETPVFRHVGVISTFVGLSTQRQGVGRSLMQATVQAAKAKGFTKLTATIRADNPPAVAFYLSQNFRLVGTSQQHALVNGRYVDEVLAERLL